MKLFSQIASFLAAQSKLAKVGIAILLVLVVGLIDYLTGFEIAFSIFYLAPVTVGGWFLSRRWGILISLLSALAWLMADWAGGQRYSSAIIPFWNAFVRLGFFLVVTFILSALRKSFDQLHELSMDDYLTGLSNARAFYDSAYSEIERAKRYDKPLTIAYIDLDNFKEINDRLGHLAGDQILRLVASALKTSVRKVDVVARLGGDEFAILLPETPANAAQIVFERIKKSLQNSFVSQEGRVFFSAGLVTFEHPPESVDQMIKKADDLMYQAKKQGRNSIRQEIFSG